MPEVIAREQATLLYRYGPGSVGMSVIASCFLATLPDAFTSRMQLLIWLCVMLSILFARAADILVHRWNRSSLGGNGRGDLRRVAVGVLLTAAMWGAFPILFFHSMSQLDRTYTATILSGMAGGSATVLSPLKHVAWVYCAAVLLPASIMFLVEGGQANISLGILGIIFFAIMALSSVLPIGRSWTLFERVASLTARTFAYATRSRSIEPPRLAFTRRRNSKLLDN